MIFWVFTFDLMKRRIVFNFVENVPGISARLKFIRKIILVVFV